MPKIYTHKISGASLGVYVNDDHSLEMLVEVRKKAGSALYTIVIDGNDKGRHHAYAEDAFSELSAILLADIEIIPQKFLKKEFHIYKEMLDNRTKQRKLERENGGDVIKRDSHQELCKDLPWK